MSFLKKIIPAQIYDKIRRAILFKPDDPNNLWQVLPQRQTKTSTPVARIQGFRYPSPGSRPQPSIPTRASEDAVYDTGFMKRDPRNLPKDEIGMINTSKGEPVMIAPRLNQLGSPGQKNPAVAAYDPTGLRSTMTASWPALNKAVLENAAPDHLPGPEWLNDFNSIVAECERKGIPITPGRRYKFKKITSNYNQARW